MKNKYLILTFKDAELFRTHKGTKDRIFDIGETRERDGFYKEPITQNQISNMIHALFNERPVPTLRTCLYDKNNYLYNKAGESYLKYTNIYTYLTKNGEKRTIKEKKRIKRALYNSWEPAIYPNWNLLYRYVTKKHFDWFVSSLNNIMGGDVQKEKFSDVITNLRKMVIDNNIKTKKEELIYNGECNLSILMKGLQDRKLSTITRLLQENGKIRYSHLTSSINKTAITVSSAIDDVEVYSGEIIVPINDEDIKKLKEESKGIATILDGGLVLIKEIIDEDFVDLDGFIKVKDISMEYIKIKR